MIDGVGGSTGKKTYRVIASQIREQIISGALQPGDRLPTEAELAAQLGVAHTTLREALRVLESQGLLRVQRGRRGGPVVTHPDLAPMADALAVTLQLRGTTVTDLDAARQVIEPQIAGGLAAAHTAEDLAVLSAAIDLAHTAAEDGDVDAFARAAAGVHETLLERSGNQTIVTISRLLHEVVEGYYTVSNRRSDRSTMRRAVRSYRRLVERIESGDVDGATSHWQAQMSHTVRSQDPDTAVAPAIARS